MALLLKVPKDKSKWDLSTAKEQTVDGDMYDVKCEIAVSFSYQMWRQNDSQLKKVVDRKVSIGFLHNYD